MPHSPSASPLPRQQDEVEYQADHRVDLDQGGQGKQHGGQSLALLAAGQDRPEEGRDDSDVGRPGQRHRDQHQGVPREGQQPPSGPALGVRLAPGQGHDHAHDGDVQGEDGYLQVPS